MRTSILIACAMAAAAAAQSPAPWCLFQDLRAGAKSSSPGELTYVKDLDRLFFSADHATDGRELYVSDGTRAGTRRIDLGPGAADPRDLTVLGAASGPWAWGEALAFTAQCTGGRALWVSDGTRAGTRQVVVPGLPCPNPSRLTDGSGPGADYPVLYFVTRTGSSEVLWAYEHRRRSVRRIFTGAPRRLTMVAGVLYFTRSTSAGVELWRVANYRPGRVTIFRAVGAMIGQGQKLYFAADDGTRGLELWETHISLATASLVQDLNPGTSGSSPGNFVSLGNHLYFAATSATRGRELHRISLRTTGAIQLVADIVPGAGSSNPQALAPARLRDISNGDAGSLLYFSASTAAAGRELWSTAGTSTTTKMVKDIVPGSGSSNPKSVAQYGSGPCVLFSAVTSTKGRELWSSDSTNTGTKLACDIHAGLGSGDPSDFVQFGCEMFFVASEPRAGRELYRIRYGDAALKPAIAEKFGVRGEGSMSYGGRRPHIFPTHVPRVGKTFGLFAHSGRRNANVLLILTAGCRHTPIPLGSDCFLYTGLTSPVIVPAKTDGFFGQAVVYTPIPRTTPVGTRLTAQFLVQDPEGCFVNSLNATDAMRIAVGR